MSPRRDLERLLLALEYADLAAALYLSGGSDEAARLLAAAAEQQLGDLFRLISPSLLDNDEEVAAMLRQIAKRYVAPRYELRSHAQARADQPVLARLDTGDGARAAEARNATASFLRAVWYLLESMGLQAMAPLRLNVVIDRSTIYSPDV
jgi:hypothetical protein